MNYQELLKKTEVHVNLFYSDHTDANLYYHNYSHAMEILGNAKKIAEHYHLDDHTFFIVCAAACFQNLGYMIKNVESHKMESAKLARVFLSTFDVNETNLAAIDKCILATQIPQKPESLAEEILCDADLYHLGTDSFLKKNKLLRKEMGAFGNTKIDGNAWRESTIRILENHQYHTGYCQSLLNKTKAANLKQLRNKQEKKKNHVKADAPLKDSANGYQRANERVAGNKPAAKPKKIDPPLRGIETMFRISASKNIRISEMADSKSNIMISVNSIIISVILGLMARTLEENPSLIIPTILLLAVNVATIIFSVLATRPKIANGRFTREDVTNRSVNLLYFGSFYNMTFKEYDDGLKAMMVDREFLYGSLSKDTYWQGKVLGHKYRLLRISYTIFLYGIIAAVLAFSAAIIFF